MPSGDLHTEAGPNPKLNPGSCANKEEKEKSLPAASGAVDCGDNQRDVPCNSGIPEQTTNHPKIEAVDFV